MALVQVERPSDGAPEGLLVLHHGRGSDERDLLGLADVLDPARRLHVVSPRAPLTLPGWPGYHWYVVPRVGYPDPDTFRASYGELAALHDELWERTGVGPERTVLGGFSMGSVMSYVARPRAGPPRARRHPRLQRVRPDRRGLGAGPAGGAPARPVFIAHGRSDPVMNVEFAHQARALLEGGGLPVSYHESTPRTTSTRPISRSPARECGSSEARPPPSG